MQKRHLALGIGALGASLASLSAAIVAGVLSAADSGTSGGPQFVVAERAWLVAGAVVIAAAVLSVISIVSGRGRRLGMAGLIIAVLAAPIAVIVMDSLPPA